MTPEERAAEFARLAAVIDAALVEMSSLRSQIATRQVRLDGLLATYEAARRDARQLVPRDASIPEVAG